MGDRVANDQVGAAEPSGSTRRSGTSGRLTAAVSRTYDVESAVTERVLLAGMLLRVREMLLREIDSVLNKFGTSHARYQVLSIVCNTSDGLQLGEIAVRASVHPTTMTSTIDRLARDGLIERRADPDDRRGILAIATPRGKKLYQQARAQLAELEYGLADLDSATTQRLLDDLDKVAAVLEARSAATG